MTESRGITRRCFIQAGAGAMTVAAAGDSGTALTPGPEPSGGRLNILFIMADQFRGDCVGADVDGHQLVCKGTSGPGGHPCVQTPNLDRIAREGVLFHRAYSCTPTCTPARAALLTGLAPWHNGMLGYGRVAPRYSQELPRAMADAGYYTLGIGKMHWHPQRNLHGFHRTILDESGREESYDFKSDYRCWFASKAPGRDPDATGIG